MLAHYHTGTMPRVSPALDREQPPGYGEINPAGAGHMDIRERDMLTVASKQGRIEVTARISRAVLPGNLILTHSFWRKSCECSDHPEASAPLAKIPEFKVGKARAEKLRK